MRGRTIYIIGVVAFVVMVAMLMFQMPRRFVWAQTHGATDTQPYGCAVFDSLMRQTMPNGYTVSNKTLEQFLREKDAPNVLLLANQLDLDSVQLDALWNLAEHGSTVLVACHEGDPYGGTAVRLANDYGICFFPHSYTYTTAIRDVEYFTPIRWWGDSLYAPYGCEWPDVLTSSYIVPDTLSFVSDEEAAQKEVSPAASDSVVCIDLLASITTWDMPEEDVFMRMRRGDPPYDYPGQTKEAVSWDGKLLHRVAVVCQVGRGSVVFVSMPLLFTNYGVLTDDTRPVLMRLMNQLKDRPVVRTTCYQPQTEEQPMVEGSSPTGFFLSHAPLRTALQVVAVLVVLLMVFKARRRQRVIPVYQPPTNRTLEFAQLIGSLYYQRRDNLDLVRKKYRVFVETLRRRLDIDVLTAKDEPSDVQQLARRTGLPPEYLTNVFHSLRNAYFGEWQISDMEMKRLVEQMNDITERL